MIGAAAEAEETGLGDQGRGPAGELPVALEAGLEVAARAHEGRRIGNHHAESLLRARLGGEPVECIGPLEAATLGKTVASASTMEADLRSFEGDKTAKARKVGELVAARAKDAGVEAVVFDRGGSKYHGRIAAIADGAREGGLSL